MKTNLFLLILLSLVSFSLLGEETASAPKEVDIQFTESPVTTDYLTAKADSDAIKVGVVEIVTETEGQPQDESLEAEAESESESKELSIVAGPAEIATSLAVPLAFTGIGASLGVLPASKGYAGMAVTPLTTTLGAGIGAVCGALFTPFVALKGVFDTFTLAAFTDTDFNINDNTGIMEDQIGNVNELVLFNNPFNEDEIPEAVIVIVEEEVDPEEASEEAAEESNEETPEETPEETAEETAN